MAGEYLPLNEQYYHRETTDLIDVVLDADSRAISIRLNETQTNAPFVIRDNADAVVFGINPEPTTGTYLDLTVDTLTTGAGIRMDDADALTTGVVLDIGSAATAITGAGRLIYSYHSGATSTSGVLNELKTDATDETVLLELDSASVSGNVLDVNCATTTGTTVAVDGTAFTTGSALVITDNSADTGTRSVVKIVQDNATATGATALEVQQDGDSYAIKISGATTKGIDLTAIGAGEPALNFTDGNASSIDPSATAETGWLNVAVGGTLRYIPYYAAS